MSYTNAQEIKDAVGAGEKVCWKNPAYVVEKHDDDYFIVFQPGDSTIGLTWRDGVTLNGNPEDFYAV